MELIAYTRPKKLLDIGVGFGKYGFLAREFLELWDGREKYDDWTVQIDGIEAYEEYITDLQKKVYSRIYIGTAQDILPTLKDRYDLILLIDVLEHLERNQALELIKTCLDVSRNLALSTPKEWIPQEDAFGNDFETHRSHWTKSDLKGFPGAFFVPNETSLICYMGEDSADVKRAIPQLNKGKNLLVKRAPVLQRAYHAAKKKTKG